MCMGLRIIDEVRSQPMWMPRRTRETREDAPDDEAQRYSLTRLWGAFAALALLLGVSGWVMEKAATTLATETGMSQTAVGILLTSVATSLPELVTAVAAVRRGALTLAVGGIIGGNAFDTLFAAASDIAYRDGSIYHAVSDQTLLWIALSVLMTAVLLLGLVRREKHGPARIGFESVALVLFYGAGVAMVFHEAS